MPKIDDNAFKKLEDQKTRDQAASQATGPDKVAAEVEAIGFVNYFPPACVLDFSGWIRKSIKLILETIDVYFFLTRVSTHHQTMLSGPVQQRAVLKRYIDSLLGKMNKIRTLVRDLKKNYPDDPTVQLNRMQLTLWAQNVYSPYGLHQLRPIKSLEDHLANMDAQYEVLNEHWAIGEHLDDKATKTSCPKFWLNNLYDLKSFVLQVVDNRWKEDEGNQRGVRFPARLRWKKSYVA